MDSNFNQISIRNSDDDDESEDRNSDDDDESENMIINRLINKYSDPDHRFFADTLANYSGQLAASPVGKGMEKMLKSLRPTSSTGSENTEEGTEDKSECRICFEEEGRETEKRLLQPCLCFGTVKYIHQDCWKSCGYYCATCKYPPTDVYEERALEFLRNGIAINQRSSYTALQELFHRFVTIPTGLFELQRVLRLSSYYKSARCAETFTFFWIGTNAIQAIYKMTSVYSRQWSRSIFQFFILDIQTMNG